MLGERLRGFRFPCQTFVSRTSLRSSRRHSFYSPSCDSAAVSAAKQGDARIAESLSVAASGTLVIREEESGSFLGSACGGPGRAAGGRTRPIPSAVMRQQVTKKNPAGKFLWRDALWPNVDISLKDQVGNR